MVHKFFCTWLLCFAWLPCASAQFDPLVSPRQVPQAQTAQELDDYLDTLEVGSAKDKLKLLEAFVQNYPNSELLGIAYQYQMLAYRDLNDYDGVIRSGEKALRLHPDNLNTLLTLASTLPNGVSTGSTDDPKLVLAEQYARQVFAGIERMTLPRSVSLERWEELRCGMEASAHEALGHIATKRGRLQEAILEFEKAVQQNPVPQGTQFYRLGVAYMLAQKNDPAKAALNRAAELGPDEIRRMANAMMQKLKSGSY